MVVVLDDLQAADTSSLRLLRFVAGQLADMRLLVLGTYRDTDLTPTHPLTDAVADLAREPTTRTLTIRGLDRIALRTLIGATAGQEPSEQLVSAFVRGTKGNPLYASEAVRLLSAEGRLEELARATSGHVAVPPGVRAAIGRRLERLDVGDTGAPRGRRRRRPGVRRLSCSARSPSWTHRRSSRASKRRCARVCCSRSAAHPAGIGSRMTSCARRCTTN